MSSAPYYADAAVTVHHQPEDGFSVLASLPDCSVDAVVTDPPYGLGFMGQKWDTYANEVGRAPAAGAKFDHIGGNHNPSNSADATRTRRVESRKFGAWCDEWTAECLRVLKPGGHLLAFGGTRTWHRLACAVEDAGFEVRDSIAWLYGSGFPKSLDVSKAIDRMDATDERRARNLRFTSWLRSTGITSRQIDEATSSFMGGHYLTAREQAAVPTAEMFDKVRPLLSVEIPEWVEALVQERTVESENYKARARIGKGTSGATAGMQLLGPSGIAGGDFDITAPATPDAARWQGWGTAMKPAFEPVVCARKPLNMVPLDWRLVARVHHALAGLLWLSLSPAKRAELSSPSSRAGRGAAWCASARVSAAADMSPEGFAAMGTCNSPALLSTSSSIASSWSSILDALSDPTRTSTTSTASSTTTALRTLNSLLAPITSQTTMPPCGCLLGGSASTAESAESGSTDEWASWLHTLSASAPESAIEGIAVAAASVCAQVAESLSADPGAGSSAAPTATTGAAASGSPAFEPIVVARKPLAGTVAANVLAHGTGALNIAGCRIGTDERTNAPASSLGNGVNMSGGKAQLDREATVTAGRWPANVVLDESQAEVLDEQSGVITDRNSGNGDGWRAEYVNGESSKGVSSTVYRGEGGASRFFYVAKADASERVRVNGTAHPTVKPLALMRWLVRLVTPPGGTVLEPFAGSGTTVEACLLEGFHCIAIEREADYLPLIRQRINRRRDPVAAVKGSGEDGGLFDLLEGETA